MNARGPKHADIPHHGEVRRSTQQLVGKYLLFALADERYGVPIGKVIEIISAMQITPVPRTPTYLKGIINLRGQIIPVIDLRLTFGLDPTPYNEKTCIMVMRMRRDDREIPVGVVVDIVLEVKDFSEDQLAPAPTYGSSVDTRFVTGMGKQTDGGVVVLVDLDRALTNDSDLALLGATL